MKLVPLRAATVILALIGPSLCFGSPVARMSASRLSGPAPLAVFFDATATSDSTTGVEPFRELGYRFDFGDVAAGKWAYSGLSKNEQIGAPLAAHVFESPGTYTVQVTAKDAAGATSVASVTISVQSADTVYAGANTVCISTTTDFSGCPAGAQQIASASAWPTFASSKRYLLHTAQNFSALGDIRFQAAGGAGLTDSQLGTFGSGAQPTVSQVNVSSGTTPDTQWNKRNVVMNLNVTKTIMQYIGGYDLLVLRNTVAAVGGGTAIEIAQAWSWYVTNNRSVAWPNPQNIFVVENAINANFSSSSYGITGNAVNFALLGNVVDQTYYHNVRLWQASKAIVAHNSLSGRIGGSTWLSIKIHANGLDPVANTTLPLGSAPSERSSYITVADNQLGSTVSNTTWQSAFQPQNDQSAEGLEYVIIEDNQYRHGANSQLDIDWGGRQMTERGNSDIADGTAARVGSGHTGSLPAAWLGPYFPGQASMKPRFGSLIVRPLPPGSLTVQ